MKNVGGIDRILRIVIGLALVAYAFNTDTLWAYIGVVPLLTGIFGFCPAYCPLKLSTAKSCGSCCGGSCESKQSQENKH